VKNCTQIDVLACTQEREGNRARSDKKRNRKASTGRKKCKRNRARKNDEDLSLESCDLAPKKWIQLYQRKGKCFIEV